MINDELKDKLEIKAFRFLGSTFDENNLLEVKGIKNKDKEKTEKSLEDAKKNLQINNEKIESNNQEIQTNKINISFIPAHSVRHFLMCTILSGQKASFVSTRNMHCVTNHVDYTNIFWYIIQCKKLLLYNHI